MNSPTTSDGGRPVRVAVADDTADIRLMLRVAMQSRTDVELVGEATNGHEAIGLVAALRPDLLILDVNMPLLDGISALPAIRTASPQTRVVMLSAISTPEHRASARRAGARAYVEKTTSIRRLVDDLLRVADLLDGIAEIVSSTTLRGDSNDLAAPARARRFVTSALAEWGEDGLRDVTELLVSELVGNVVRHTDTAPEVVVRLTADHLHVEVADADPTPPAPRRARRDDVGGRGFELVQSLALEWGWAPTEDGKVVWFDLARAASTGSSATEPVTRQLADHDRA